MSSTPQSIPLTRRISGGLAIAVGVIVAIAVAVTLIAVVNSKNTVQTSHVRTSHTNVASTQQTRYLGPREAGAVVNGGPLPAAVGKAASTPTVQPNPDEQGIASQYHSRPSAKDLPGWLLR